MSSIVIRRLRSTDSLDELTSLIHRAFAPLGRMGLRCTGVDQTLETTAKRIRRGECFVALDGERLAGTMTLEAPNRLSECHWYRRSGVASLHQFAIDPRHQRTGCGRALMAFAEGWARQRGHCELALETPAEAKQLVSFYEAQGFRAVSRFRKADKDYSSVVLSKRVAEPARHVTPWFAPSRTLWTGALVRC